MEKFTNKKGKLRLYDSTGTPYYLEIEFDAGDFSGPLGAPKTEENLQLNRGVMDEYAHYIEGSDDKLMEPIAIAFSAFITDNAITTYLLDWILGNTVNGNTIVTTKGDTQRDGANNNPAFADTGKKCCNVELLYNTSGTDLLMQYNEVYFPLEEQNIKEAEDGVTLSLSGMVYGTITKGSAFTAGTDVTA